MPDRDDHKTPLPAVMDVGAFFQKFGNDEACLEHLRIVRWGEKLERFECPDCGNARGWWLSKRKLVECCECHKQTSVTAGTVFHRLRSPLWKWFWAVYQLAQDKKGIAALELAKQIGVCYTTAWLMLHKHDGTFPLTLCCRPTLPAPRLTPREPTGWPQQSPAGPAGSRQSLCR